MKSKDYAQNLAFNNFVHFRKLRSILSKLCKYENKNLNYYDTRNIKCYQTIGDNMKAPTVKTKTVDGSAIFVSDNRYYIAEIPNTRNKKDSPNGNFLFLAYNVSFDYWLFGEINVGKANNDSKFYTESVVIKPFGCYKIALTETIDSFIKTAEGRNISYGAHTYTHKIFDIFEDRKRAYKKQLATSTAKKNNQTYKGDKVFSSKKVPVYRKNNHKK